MGKPIPCIVIVNLTRHTLQHQASAGVVTDHQPDSGLQLFGLFKVIDKDLGCLLGAEELQILAQPVQRRIIDSDCRP